MRTPVLNQRALRAPLALLTLVVVLGACDATPVDNPNDEELITQVTVTLTNEADPQDVQTIVATDADGDGAGIVFSLAAVPLRQGASYNGAIGLRDTVNGGDITGEIEEEAEAHLFSYAFVPAASGSVAVTDLESDYVQTNTNGGDFAVGLRFRVMVAAAASGAAELQVRLYHFDTIPKGGNSATSDEIDLDLSFPVDIVAPVAP